MLHILYSNYFWENDEHGKDAYDYAREYLFEVYSEDEDWENQDEVPEERVIEQVYSDDECNFDDFKYEFSKFIDESRNGFILCGTVGRWDGRYNGGCYVHDFDDLYKFWDGCRDIKVYDEKGHLYIEATHHDGSNYAELKEITDKGEEYVCDHMYDSDEDVHSTLVSCNFYTRLPHYAHKVYGCKKGW